MPPAVFSPERAVSAEEALTGERFHVYCGTGQELLAERAVGGLFRGSVDSHEVLILLRRGPQTFVYTKVDGLSLHLSNGRVLALPADSRFELAPELVERGVFRWERYWWRVTVRR